MRILSTLWRRFTILLSNLSGSFKILAAAFVQRFREPAARSGFKMDYTDICSIYERRLQCPAAVGCQVMGYTRYKRRAEVRITWPRCTVSYGLYSQFILYVISPWNGRYIVAHVSASYLPKDKCAGNAFGRAHRHYFRPIRLCSFYNEVPLGRQYFFNTVETG